MKEKIKILIAEHDAIDLELLHDELMNGGIDYTHKIVDNEREFSAAIQSFVPDIILADCIFPSFDGRMAFSMRQKLAPETPFIIVSGVVNEQESVELIKNGVTDYVLKDKLFTLVPKVSRALLEAKERKLKFQADDQLKKSEQRYRTLFEQNLAGIYQSTSDGVIVNLNYAFARMIGYDSVDELVGVHVKDLYFSPLAYPFKVETSEAERQLLNHEVVLRCKDQSKVYAIENISMCKGATGEEEFCDVILIDISKRKKDEQEIEWMINNTEESFILLNRRLEITSYNNEAKELYSRYFPKDLIKGVNILEYARAERVGIVKEIYTRVLKGAEVSDELIIPILNGDNRNFSIKYKPATDENGEIIGVFVSAIDITERKRAEARQEFERRDKEALINTTTDLIWSVSSDFKLIAANKAFINSLIAFNGVFLKPGDELLMKDKFPSEYLSFWQSMYQRALGGDSFIQEVYFPSSDNKAEAWGEINFNPIYDGEQVTGTACYSRDTTSAKNYQTSLIDINKKLKSAQQISHMGYWELNLDVNTLFWSDEVYNIWNESQYTFPVNFKKFYDTIHPSDRAMFDKAQKRALEGRQEMDIEHRIVLASGKIKYVHEKGGLVYDKGNKAIRFEGTVQDITERKELESLLNKANKLARIGNWEMDLSKNTLYWSEITKEIHEAERGFVPNLRTAIQFYKEGNSRDIISRKVKEAIDSGTPWDEELQIITTKGNEIWVRCIGDVEWVNNKVFRLYGSFQDIDQRKRSEFEVAEMQAERNTILESIDDAFFAVDKNWVVTYWNIQAEKVLGKTRSQMLGNDLWSIFSDSVDSESYKKYHEALDSTHSVHFEDFYPPLGVWYEISAYPSLTGLSVYFKDVSERKLSEVHMRKLNEDLQEQAKQLSISNSELERFAYVASHDLQEPLRMITSFLTQLEKKYSAIIDEKGKKYIGFAVDGAKRMRQIILDLLEYSKVGRTAELLETLDLNEIVGEVIILNRKKIEEKNAVIESERLPIIRGHRPPVLQVFQNLISNALKYSKSGTDCIVQIAVTEFEDHWQFTIRDNGIGIAEEYFEKIFIIFQRLHNKDEYSGTGVGLAVTRKIIESEGGRIWVESEEGIGSVFYFTMKK